MDIVELKPVRCAVGNVEIIGVNDFSEIQSTDWFPKAAPAELAHFEKLYPNRICGTQINPFTYFCYVICDQDHRILVDAGVGDGRGFAPHWKGTLPDRLSEQGIRCQDITEVVFTHLHADHVGWSVRCTDHGWEKTFPNARYLAQKADYAAYHTGITTAAFPEGCFETCVQTLVDQGQFELITDDEYVLTPNVRLKRAPGHTPGSQYAVIRSHGQCCLLTGDCFDSPIQVSDPEIDYIWDIDKAGAAQARKAIMEAYGAEGTLLGGCHFGLGRLTYRDGQCYWEEI